MSEEVSTPTAVLCYPYGQSADISPAIARIARSAGLKAAVTAMPGYLRIDRHDDLALFALPRFSLPDSLTDFRQITSGLDRLKVLVRSLHL